MNYNTKSRAMPEPKHAFNDLEARIDELMERDALQQTPLKVGQVWERSDGMRFSTKAVEISFTDRYVKLDNGQWHAGKAFEKEWTYVGGPWFFLVTGNQQPDSLYPYAVAHSDGTLEESGTYANLGDLTERLDEKYPGWKTAPETRKDLWKLVGVENVGRPICALDSYGQEAPSEKPLMPQGRIGFYWEDGPLIWQWRLFEKGHCKAMGNAKRASYCRELMIKGHSCSEIYEGRPADHFRNPKRQGPIVIYEDPSRNEEKTPLDEAASIRRQFFDNTPRPWDEVANPKDAQWYVEELEKVLAPLSLAQQVTLLEKLGEEKVVSEKSNEPSDAEINVWIGILALTVGTFIASASLVSGVLLLVSIGLTVLSAMFPALSDKLHGRSCVVN